jgi:pimeloyl-ACP methyl ester carboxylesterase
MNYLLPLLLSVLVCTCVRAQTYVSVTAQEDVSVAAIRQNLPPLFAVLVPLAYPVKTYKVTYNTVDAFGEPEVASGMISVPQNADLSFPLAVYMHGTVTDREAVPSRQQTAERLLINVIASSGYITVAPDYIGLGDSEGFHPYVHAASESSAGRDLILAARQWLSEQGISYNEQLFVTGYSQGGHAAQALHRDLQMDEDNDSLNVTAGAHLSGPYDISGVMRRAALSEEQVTLPGYIIYTYVSYNNVYGLYDNLEQVFVAPYLDVIRQYDEEAIDGNAFNAELSRLLNENDDRLVDMFQDSIRQQLEENDDDSRIVQALRANDTYNWAPETPTLLVYCTADEQVPFENSLVADSVMRELGSEMVTVQVGGDESHTDCVGPALISTLNFFGRYASIDSATTSVGRLLALPELKVSPNPVGLSQLLQVSGLDAAATFRYELYGMAGRRVQTGVLSETDGIQLGRGLRSGTYVLRIIRHDGNYAVRRVVVR